MPDGLVGRASAAVTSGSTANSKIGRFRHGLLAEAIVNVAMIAVRDGGTDFIVTYGEWIRETLKRAFHGKRDPAHTTRVGLRYNPITIAFVGTALLLKHCFDMADVRTLLEAAGDPSPAVGEGFCYVVELLAEIDERLPRAILRCAFAACVQPTRQWATAEADEYKARLEARLVEVAAAIEAEIAWLSKKANEPAWPAFVLWHVNSRHQYSFTGRRRKRYQMPEMYTDHQVAALWLGKAANIFDVAQRPWLRDLARAYLTWTAIANGPDLDKDDHPDRIPHGWNHAYFNLLARCLPGLTIPQIDSFALGMILALPGEAFLDVMTIFIRCVDKVYFNGTASMTPRLCIFARRWRAVSWRYDNGSGSAATAQTESRRI